MLRILYERIKAGSRTVKWPKEGYEEAELPERFRGLPQIEASRCDNCGACSKACPQGAWLLQNGHYQLDLGCCIFCGDCALVCPTSAISYSKQYKLAQRTRQDLLYTPLAPRKDPPDRRLDEIRRKLFDRSLKIRPVSAGGCGACEAEAHMLSTALWDMSRFGMSFVASPRHADALLVTGPVTAQMREALLQTYAAMPEPKLVIACGVCAISGGPFAFTSSGSLNEKVCGGVDALLPVDLYVPGCPPHPQVLLDGLLALLGRIP